MIHDREPRSPNRAIENVLFVAAYAQKWEQLLVQQRDTLNAAIDQVSQFRGQLLQEEQEGHTGTNSLQPPLFFHPRRADSASSTFSFPGLSRSATSPPRSPRRSADFAGKLAFHRGNRIIVKFDVPCRRRGRPVLPLTVRFHFIFAGRNGASSGGGETV